MKILIAIVLSLSACVIDSQLLPEHDRHDYTDRGVTTDPQLGITTMLCTDTDIAAGVCSGPCTDTDVAAGACTRPCTDTDVAAGACAEVSP